MRSRQALEHLGVGMQELVADERRHAELVPVLDEPSCRRRGARNGMRR